MVVVNVAPKPRKFIPPTPNTVFNRLKPQKKIYNPLLRCFIMSSEHTEISKNAVLLADFICDAYRGESSSVIQSRGELESQCQRMLDSFLPYDERIIESAIRDMVLGIDKEQLKNSTMVRIIETYVRKICAGFPYSKALQIAVTKLKTGASTESVHPVLLKIAKELTESAVN